MIQPREVLAVVYLHPDEELPESLREAFKGHAVRMPGFCGKVKEREQSKLIMRVPLLKEPTPALLIYSRRAENGEVREYWKTQLLDFSDGSPGMRTTEVTGTVLAVNRPGKSMVSELVREVNDPRFNHMIPEGAEFLEPNDHPFLDAAMCVIEDFYRHVKKLKRVVVMIRRDWRLKEFYYEGPKLVTLWVKAKGERKVTRHDLEGRSKEHFRINRLKLTICQFWPHWGRENYTLEMAAEKLSKMMGYPIGAKNLWHHVYSLNVPTLKKVFENPTKY
ncbi:MAG: hypothetical protein AAGK14_00175 [Verrucomicrobiota bacterium]